MTREYPEHPLPGVAAVVRRGDQVLLVRRGREPAKGAWALPGGLLELGESVEEGLRRELREECGIEVQVGPLIAVFEPVERDQVGRVRFHFVVLDYLADYLSGELQAADDAADVRWVHIAALDDLPMLPETRAIIRRALSVDP